MADRRRRRILFVHNDDPAKPLSSFFLQDLEHLRREFDVEILSVYPLGYWHLTALAHASIWRAVWRCDAIFGWFGSSAPIVMMGAALGKPSVIIAGGSDVAYVPEIGYGLDPRQKVTYHLYTQGFRLARQVLLFSEASRRDFLRLPGVSAERSRTLYLGIDSDHFRPAGSKKRQVLTVSYISSSALLRKGLLSFAEAARLCPDVPHRIAGMVVDEAARQKLAAAAPPNVEILGYLDDNQLLAEFQAASVYVQLSHHEGFGASLAEAMACGCIPVATERGSIPEVVGDTGYYVPVDDPVAASTAIRAALERASTTADEAARRRIVEKFQPDERRRGLLEVLDGIVPP
jgi:glycosyltransferase involved in cell wall biosynthesis